MQEGGITVTKTRFVAGAQIYALSGITSVRGVEIEPSRAGPITVVGSGLCLLGLAYAAETNIVVFLIVFLITAAIAGFWWVKQKPSFAVVCTTAGGEVTALTSGDKLFVSRVIEAITQAIIARG